LVYAGNEGLHSPAGPIQVPGIRYSSLKVGSSKIRLANP